MTRSTSEFLRVARERFRQGQEASAKQRQRMLDDLAFYAGGEHQWDPDTLRSRKAQGATGGMPPVPARPCLTINKVKEPVHQVQNQERQSEMGISLVPADDWGDLATPVSDNEIELREGLTRRIQRESEAADARSWAFARATIAGEGTYRVLTRYVPGKTWDKEVYVARIYNQASVTWDPAHEQPDGSDAEWVFIGADLPWDRYRREHPRVASGAKNLLAQADDAAFRALGEEYPGWFTATGDTRSARVVEYFYTEWMSETLVKLASGETFWRDEFPEDLPKDQIVDEREVVTKQIKWAKIDATQILEETDWEGPDMPVIKVLGEELQPFDGERRVEGMVRPARDAQQGFNAMVSKWVESVGLAPIPPFQVAEGQVEGYEQWYQAANTRTLPYLPYRTKDLTGTSVGAPTRTNVDTPIQAIAASVQMFDEAIKSTTLVPSVQLGQATDAQLKSGKAIQALQEQAALGTSNYLDNLRRSIRYEGQIINNLLYPIYGRPGRLARMLNGENEPVAVRIAGSNGSAAPMVGVAGRQPSGPMPPAARASAPAEKQYALTEHANFNVIVKVTRSFDSRRTEEATTIGNLLQAQPALMAWFGDLFFKNQDGPGHAEMAERAEVMLDPKIQQLRQSKQQGTPVPPELQAQLAQLQQQVQQAEQILTQAKQELESKDRELTLKLQMEREKFAHDKEMQVLKNATAIRVAELGARKDVLLGAVEDEEEAIALGRAQAHELATTAANRQQELERAGEPPPVEQPAVP